MSVNAITSYSSVVQYQYFGTTIAPARIQQLMEYYGIIPTGDSEIDLRELYNVMYANADTEVAGTTAYSNQLQQAKANSQIVNTDTSATVPWANLMNQVGLSATGDLSTDYKAFTDRIWTMQTSAGISAQQQANIAQWQAESQIVFVQNEIASQLSGKAANLKMASGADIVAQLNKLLFVGT